MQQKSIKSTQGQYVHKWLLSQSSSFASRSQRQSGLYSCIRGGAGRQSMGDTVSMAKDRQVSVRGFSVVCDDCGAIFYVSHEIVSGRENKKRCSRCSAIMSEERVGRHESLRKCSTCQSLFTVPRMISDQPPNHEMNCLRCGDTHRELIRAKDYVQVSLQRGMDRMTVTCPRSMQSELRRCITNRQEQGYNMLSLTEESI